MSGPAGTNGRGKPHDEQCFHQNIAQGSAEASPSCALPVLHFSWSSAWLHAMSASNRQHHLGADTHRVWLDL
jgi:hypothetical protein